MVLVVFWCHFISSMGSELGTLFYQNVFLAVQTLRANFFLRHKANLILLSHFQAAIRSQKTEVTLVLVSSSGYLLAHCRTVFHDKIDQQHFTGLIRHHYDVSMFCTQCTLFNCTYDISPVTTRAAYHQYHQTPITCHDCWSQQSFPDMMRPPSSSRVFIRYF